MGQRCNKKANEEKGSIVLEKQQLHKKACQEHQYWYVDPESGFRVLTAFFLKKREYCCRSGCRHCPYGWDVTSACHKISGVPKIRTIQLWPGLHDLHEVVIIPTVVSDLILKREGQNLEEAFSTFKQLDGKHVKLEGLREQNYFIVTSWEEYDENKTSKY